MRLKHLLLAFTLSVGCNALNAQQAPTADSSGRLPAAGGRRPFKRRAGCGGTRPKPSIEVSPPHDKDSVRFAIIGDSGTGDAHRSTKSARR